MRPYTELKDFTIETANNYFYDDIPLHSAALAFYTIFSLAPLLIVIVAISGFLFSEDISQQQLHSYLHTMVGPEATSTLMNILSTATLHKTGIIATVISAVVLIFGATTVFTQLKNTLNRIWNVVPKPGQTIRSIVVNRLLALLTVLLLALLMILSLILEAIMSFIKPVVNTALPLGIHFWDDMNTAFTILITMILFGAILKLLPDVKIPWWIATVGAIITTALFLIGKFLIGIYLSMGHLDSTYGAAGSLIVFLVWVYYNAMIVYLGAEITHSLMRRYEEKIQPSSHVMLQRYPDEEPNVDPDAMS
ncbi:MAG TPA: YihY/virulence factor BrkB family protein [Balneolales bacterium]|nr:YihY/virulence factor BrkB family protein [Balneolales bacterium]